MEKKWFGLVGFNWVDNFLKWIDFFINCCGGWGGWGVGGCGSGKGDGSLYGWGCGCGGCGWGWGGDGCEVCSGLMEKVGWKGWDDNLWYF